MEHIGKAIREYRIGKGLSQAELARKVGIDRTTLVKYESEVNQPPFDVVERINEALHANLINHYFNEKLMEQDFREKITEYICKKNNYTYDVSEWSERDVPQKFEIKRYSKEKEKWLTFSIEQDDLYNLIRKFTAHMSLELSLFLDELEEQENYGTEEE